MGYKNFNLKDALAKKRAEREKLQKEIEARKNQKSAKDYILKPNDGDLIKFIPILVGENEYTDEIVVNRYFLNKRKLYSAYDYGYSECPIKEKQIELSKLGLLYVDGKPAPEYKKFLSMERHFMLGFLVKDGVAGDLKWIDLSKTHHALLSKVIESSIQEGVDENDIMGNLDESYLFKFGTVESTYNGLTYQEIELITLSRNKHKLNLSDEQKDFLTNTQYVWSETAGSTFGLYLEKYKVQGKPINWKNNVYVDGKLIDIGDNMVDIANFHVQLALGELYSDDIDTTTQRVTDNPQQSNNDNAETETRTPDQEKLIADFKKTLNL